MRSHSAAQDAVLLDSMTVDDIKKAVANDLF
jgi:hypothetical protein